MNKEITLKYNNEILEITGYYSGEDRNTNKPSEFDLSEINYKGVNILPLLEAIDSGFELLEDLEDQCIANIKSI